MAEVRIVAEPRTEFGKGAARRVRRDHKVPAVLYGHGTDPQHVSLPGHELMLALAHGSNTLLRLTGLDGGEELVLPRAVQRDPVKGVLEHVDLLLVRIGEKVTVEVPVVTLGEVVSGGLLDQQRTTVTLESEATHIPSQVEVVIDALEVGAAVHARDLTLPEGSTLAIDAETVIVHILPAPSAEELEAELEQAEAELGAGPSGGLQQEAAQEEVEGEVAGDTTGEGEAVPATDEAGGPAESQTPRGEE